RLFRFNYPNRLLFASSRIFNYPKLDNLVRGADVFFSPHFFSAPLSSGCRSGVTFHDLSFIRYPEFFSWRKNIWHRLEMNPRRQAQRADKIIAVSESTRSDLISLFGVSDKKIEVIYSGVTGQAEGNTFLSADEKKYVHQSLAKESVRKKYNLPDNFFLFLGMLEPRKNILGILKAFVYLKSTGQVPGESALVIAGPLGWLYADILKFHQESPFRGSIRFIGPVEEKDKPYLYLLSRVFVYPSFFEGFGFPPLEAMTAGVPVVTSGVSSLPEVAGEAALLVNPFNVKEIAEAMKNLFLNEKLRDFYIRKGLERAKEFSWKKTAEETLQVLVESVG
ncbi:MAG: Glycosyl transferase group 1, partial [Parcubacteria group bacterium Gr01-1014_44]